MISMHDFWVIALALLTIIMIVSIDGYLIFNVNRSLTTKSYYSTRILLLIWVISLLFRSVSHSPLGIWIFIITEYFGIIFFTIEFFAFSHIYRHATSLNKYIHLGLFGIGFFWFAILLSNPLTHLFFLKIDSYNSINGPWFKFYALFLYGLTFLSFVNLCRSTYFRLMTVSQKILILATLLVPVGFNLLHLINTKSQFFDFTTISITFVLSLFAIVAFRSNYLETKKFTRPMLIEQLSDGIIILSKDYRVIDYNQKSQALLANVFSLKRYANAVDLFHYLKPYIPNYDRVQRTFTRFIQSKHNELKTDVRIVADQQDFYYMVVLQKEFNPTGEHVTTILKLVDISRSYALTQSLNQKNIQLEKINNKLLDNISIKHQLSLLNERNSISKEIHDVLGHSLTLVISILSLIQADTSLTRADTLDKISNAIDIIRNGLGELKNSTRHSDDKSSSISSLINSLEALAKKLALSGVQVDLINHADPIGIKAETHKSLYRFCQESMTNSLRHGHATNITIALRTIHNQIDVIIIDNGRGCQNLVKGNGLNSIEAEVKQQNGFFSCGSPDGAGFNVHISLPNILTD